MLASMEPSGCYLPFPEEVTLQGSENLDGGVICVVTREGGFSGEAHTQLHFPGGQVKVVTFPAASRQCKVTIGGS